MHLLMHFAFITGAYSVLLVFRGAFIYECIYGCIYGCIYRCMYGCITGAYSVLLMRMRGVCEAYARRLLLVRARGVYQWCVCRAGARGV